MLRVFLEICFLIFPGLYPVKYADKKRETPHELFKINRIGLNWFSFAHFFLCTAFFTQGRTAKAELYSASIVLNDSLSQ